MTQLFR